MGPTEAKNPLVGGLDRDEILAVISRLREVQRRWSEDQGDGNRGNKATEVLDAVLSDLEEALETDSGSMAAEDVDLGLAMVEEIFEAEGSQGFSRVITSIRGSLIQPADEPADNEEPPPPVRYQPPSSVAVRRRRPKPKPKTTERKSPAPAPPRKGRLGWLIIAVFVIASAGVVAFLEYQKGRPASQGVELAEPATRSRPLVSGMPILVLPQEDTRPSWAREEFDVREEEMATFTFEIRLAEDAMAEGDLNEALRHFAAAAAIDREHPRVVVTGKFLIASMMREGDLAHDAGDAALAKKRFQSARSLARGFGLENESNRPDPTEVGFEDLDPTRDGVLQGVVGLPVRLTFKTGDVVYGRGDGMDGDHLLLEVYAGTRAGGAERSMKILASTIEGIRVY